MSPTSYQTAPPRELIITTTRNNGQTNHPHFRQISPAIPNSASRKLTPEPSIALSNFQTRALALGSLLQLGTLAGGHDFRRIDGRVVDLLFQNGSIFSDQEIHAPRGF